MIRDTDHGYRKRMQALKGLRGGKIAVGVFDPARAQVAAAHEFGVPALGIPMRSFIRATIDKNASLIKNILRRLARDVAAGVTSERDANKALGAFVIALIRERIIAGITPRNKKSTLKHKRGSPPLIDTGKLFAAIKAKVLR